MLVKIQSCEATYHRASWRVCLFLLLVEAVIGSRGTGHFLEDIIFINIILTAGCDGQVGTLDKR
jgi:hypothetical protein